MKKISWNTEKIIDEFVEELVYIENRYLENEDEDIDRLWKLWDELRMAFSDEFKVQL